MKRKKPVVYICSRFSDDIETNTKKAREYCRTAVEMQCIPIAPHLLFPQFMDEETERDLAMEMDLALIDRCDELWICDGMFSKGMNREYRHAVNRNKKIQFLTGGGELICLRSGKE